VEGKGTVSVRKYLSFVFDLDGTLFTVPVDWKGVRREVERITGRPLESSPLFNQLDGIIAENPKIRSPIFSAIDSFELEAARHSRPKPGAVDFLESLAKSSKPVALVTMQGRAICDELLSRHDLDRFFSAKVTREYSLDRSEQILKVIDEIGAEPATTLLIGDLPNDVFCARRSKVDVAILGKNGPRMEPRPDYAFDSFAELRAVISI
jgi:phosphoglycolate phosphatase-like HAD superfamily hydrolase